jgi:hypothetical protein
MIDKKTLYAVKHEPQLMEVSEISLNQTDGLQQYPTY